MKKVAIIIALLLTICSLFAFAWWIGRKSIKPDTTIITDTVTDTLVDWQSDTVYMYDTKIVKLPVHDTTTIHDSVVLVDSVLVEVPIYKYRYDTVFADTHSTTRMQVVLSGYEVDVDTLVVTTTTETVVVKESLPWNKRIRPSVGLGIGTNLKGEATAGIYVGIGYLF